VIEAGVKFNKLLELSRPSRRIYARKWQVWDASRKLSRAELDRVGAGPVEHIEERYHYKEAYIILPRLNLVTIKVERISDGILIFAALGEGQLLVSTKVRDPKVGDFPMAKAEIRELVGKTKQEIYNLLDWRTDSLRDK
jgi:hypothetical protein